MTLHTQAVHNTALATAAPATAPKLEKLPRPTFSLNMTESKWNFTKDQWTNYIGQYRNAEEATKLMQLQAACHDDLRNRVFETRNFETLNTTDLFLAKMKELAVIKVHKSVHLLKLWEMRQEPEETFRAFVARVIATADMCGMSVPCVDCNKSISYRDQVVQQIVLHGMRDNDVRVRVQSLNTTGELDTLEKLMDYIAAEEASISESNNLNTDNNVVGLRRSSHGDAAQEYFPPEVPFNSEQTMEYLELRDLSGNHLLKYRRKKNEEDNVYQCCDDGCDDRQFRPVKGFRKHLYNQHLIEVDMGRKNDAKGPYIKRIVTENELLHGKEKTFKCDNGQCTATYSKKQDLTIHQKTRCLYKNLANITLPQHPDPAVASFHVLSHQSLTDPLPGPDTDNREEEIRHHDSKDSDKEKNRCPLRNRKNSFSSGTSTSESASSLVSLLDCEQDNLHGERVSVSVTCEQTSISSDLTAPTFLGNIPTQQEVKVK